jgi:CubicO group peptidase (beta-lactamase class C family)
MKKPLLGSLVSVVACCLSAAALGEDADTRRDFLEPEDRAAKYQRPDRIFPNRVATASAEPLPLPRAELPPDFDIRYEWQGETYGIDEFNERTQTNALLILKDGKIVREIYRNDSTPETRFISFSTGKSFTSTLVGMAIEDGYIESVDEQLTKYLPGLIGSAYDGVTIKDALQMASGVEWNESSYDFSDMAMPLPRHWEMSMVQHRYRYVEGANELPRVHEPGTHYNYNTLETCLLGWLVENATGRRLTTYMEERLWHPAGMEFDAAWMIDGPEEVGRELAGGMLAASLRDYGRYGLLMMRGGKSGDRQIVSPEWVTEATTPDREAVDYGNLYEGYPLGYGYQWWLFPNGRFEGQGVYGQFVYVAPEDDVVIIKLSYWPDAWVEELEYESYAFFEAAIAALNDI